MDFTRCASSTLLAAVGVASPAFSGGPIPFLPERGAYGAAAKGPFQGGTLSPRVGGTLFNVRRANAVSCRNSPPGDGGRMPESKAKGLDKDPKCVKCGSKMRFSCTEPEPGQPGFVHHIYECTKCRSTQSFVTPV
jgi:hypothetical protein